MEPSKFFPHGCKTTFKAYSSNEVYEIHKQSPDSCTTPIGVHTGFETKLVHSTWQPEPTGLNSCPGREGIEGYYLMGGVPHLEVVPLMHLEPGSSELISKCMRSIRSKFLSESLNADDRDIRNSWEDWYTGYGPESDDVDAYFEKLRKKRGGFHNPLGNRGAEGHIIWDKTQYVKPRWKLNSKPAEKIDPKFRYPAVLQAAMNSVYTKHTPHPQRPRFTAEQDVSLLAFFFEFEDKCKTFYQNLVSRDFLVTHLKALLLRLSDYSGQRLPLSGAKTKTELMQRIKTWDRSVLGIIFRSLQADQMIAVEASLDFLIENEEEAKQVVSRIGVAGSVLSRRDFQSLKPGVVITDNCLRFILEMFRVRDHRICSAYADQYKEIRDFVPRKQSLYLPPTFLSELLALESAETINLDPYFGDLENDPIESYHRVYCLYRSEVNSNNISIVLLDLESKKIEFLSPSWGNDATLADDDFMALVLAKFSILSEKINMNFGEGWSVKIFPHQFCLPILPTENGDSRAIAAFTMLYLLVHNIPVYFTQAQIDVISLNFCLWCKNGSLPH